MNRRYKYIRYYPPDNEARKYIAGRTIKLHNRRVAVRLSECGHVTVTTKRLMDDGCIALSCTTCSAEAWYAMMDCFAAAYLDLQKEGLAR